jgi:hypothetical protein
VPAGAFPHELRRQLRLALSQKAPAGQVASDRVSITTATSGRDSLGIAAEYHLAASLANVPASCLPSKTAMAEPITSGRPA